MLNTKYVRDNLDAIRESLKRRKSDFPLDRLLKLDEDWRKLKTQTQELQAKQNKASLGVSELKKKQDVSVGADIKAAAEVKVEAQEHEKKLMEYEEEINTLLWNMPNVLDESVPYGESEDDNVEIGKWGNLVKRKVPGHVEILEKLGLLELKQAAAVSGARFYYLKGDLALLEQAIIRFGIDEMTRKGYTLVAPPLMLKKEYYRGATALGDFEEMLYRVADPQEAKTKDGFERVEGELFLIATAEHSLAAMHAGQVLNGKELPKKYVGISPCFRREAGAHGKDTKGIFRVHNFYKIEQFIFCKPEDSKKYFDELLANAEGVYQKLNMPYRLLNFCTGGIGNVAAKKIDIELYLQGQAAYREIASCSNCTDWQSVRLDIKYDDKGERRYVHTLNSTLIPTERTLVAITENCYNEDGTITIPDVLVPYMGKKKIG